MWKSYFLPPSQDFSDIPILHSKDFWVLLSKPTPNFSICPLCRRREFSDLPNSPHPLPTNWAKWATERWHTALEKLHQHILGSISLVSCQFIDFQRAYKSKTHVTGAKCKISDLRSKHIKMSNESAHRARKLHTHDDIHTREKKMIAKVALFHPVNTVPSTRRRKREIKKRWGKKKNCGMWFISSPAQSVSFTQSSV